MAAGGGAGCIPSGSLAGLLVTGLVITGAIGLWSATATATARHLTLARAGTLSVPVGMPLLAPSWPTPRRVLGGRARRGALLV